MAYTDIDKPSDYFETVLYAGNAGTQSITSLDFQPDWVWCKERGTVDDGSGNDTHAVFDSVRGVQERLIPNNDSAEGTQSNGITAFNSNGFTSGDANITNGGSSRTYASWNWKAGTSFTNDASATGIGSIDSSGSVNTDAGFSICTYTGTGSAGTIKHGLSSAPKMIILKNRSVTGNWRVYHEDVGATKFLDLNTTAASSVASTIWNNTEPTSSVFSIATHESVSGDGHNLIAYCFAEKQGFSKFGSYTGNGNADGTFVYTGFKPAWIMIKATSQTGEGWFMFDNKRDVDNAVDKHLAANATTAEGSGSHGMDFVSNGIKIRNSGDGTNTSGENYIYMSFAENPFVTSTGVPATAR